MKRKIRKAVLRVGLGWSVIFSLLAGWILSQLVIGLPSTILAHPDNIPVLINHEAPYAQVEKILFSFIWFVPAVLLVVFMDRHYVEWYSDELGSAGFAGRGVPVLAVLYLPIFLIAFLSVEISRIKDGMFKNSRVISYAEGSLTIRLPAHWKMEDDENGGKLLHLTGEKKPTLRISLHEVEGGEIADSLSPETALHQNPENGSKTAKLKNGDQLVMRTQAGWESGCLLRKITWEILHAIPKDKYQQAVFTLTLPNAESPDGKLPEHYHWLEAEILQAKISGK
jgi:hypothetical protein